MPGTDTILTTAIVLVKWYKAERHLHSLMAFFYDRKVFMDFDVGEQSMLIFGRTCENFDVREQNLLFSVRVPPELDLRR